MHAVGGWINKNAHSWWLGKKECTQLVVGQIRMHTVGGWINENARSWWVGSNRMHTAGEITEDLVGSMK